MFESTFGIGQPFRVGVCDTQPVVAEGVRAILRSDLSLSWGWNAHSFEEVRRLQADDPADILLIDRALGSVHVTDWLVTLLNGTHRPRVAVWGTVMSASAAERLFSAGVSGVLTRNASVTDILECLHRLTMGGAWALPGLIPEGAFEPRLRQSGLTSREQEVCELVRRGLTNREVAVELGISAGTVKIHLQHVFAKKGVRDRASLVVDAASRYPAGPRNAPSVVPFADNANYAVAKA